MVAHWRHMTGVYNDMTQTANDVVFQFVRLKLFVALDETGNLRLDDDDFEENRVCELIGFAKAIDRCEELVQEGSNAFGTNWKGFTMTKMHASWSCRVVSFFRTLRVSLFTC